MDTTECYDPWAGLDSPEENYGPVLAQSVRTGDQPAQINGHYGECDKCHRRMEELPKFPDGSVLKKTYEPAACVEPELLAFIEAENYSKAVTYIREQYPDCKDTDEEIIKDFPILAEMAHQVGAIWICAECAGAKS